MQQKVLSEYFIFGQFCEFADKMVNSILIIIIIISFINNNNNINNNNEMQQDIST